MYSTPLPKKYRVSSPFGVRVHPITKVRSLHNGVDLACPVGMPILATFDGILTFKENKIGGTMVYLSNTVHRLGFAHLTPMLPFAPRTVKAGELIAYTGNTGMSNGPHLHFSVMILNSKSYINPLTLFKL